MIAFLKRIPKWFRMLRRLDIAADNIENYFIDFDRRLEALESDDSRIARAIERDQVLIEVEDKIRPMMARLTAFAYRLDCVEVDASERKPKRRPAKKAKKGGARGKRS